MARENERTRHKNEVQKLKAILDNTEEEPPKGEEGMRDIDDGLEGSMENGSQEDLLQAPPSALLLSQEVDNGDVLTQEDDGNADSQADDSLESVEEVTTFDRSVQSAIEVVERGVGDGVVSFEDSSQEMVEGKVKQEEDKAEEIKIEEKMAIEKYEEVHEDNVDKEHVVTKDDGDEGEIAKEKEDKEVEGKQEQLKEVKEQFEELVEEHKVEKVEKNTEDEKVGKEEQDEVKMEERVEGKKVKEKEERIEEEKAEEGNVEEKVENEEVVEDEKVLEYMVQEVNVEEKVEKVEEDKVKEEVKFEEGKVEEEIAEEEKGGQEKQVEEIDGEDSAGKDYREDLNKLADINISQETVVVEEKNSAPIPSCCPEDHDHQTKFAIDICDLVNRNWGGSCVILLGKWFVESKSYYNPILEFTSPELMSSADLLAYQIQITKDLAVTKASILQRRKVWLFFSRLWKYVGFICALSNISSIWKRTLNLELRPCLIVHYHYFLFLFIVGCILGCIINGERLPLGSLNEYWEQVTIWTL